MKRLLFLSGHLLLASLAWCGTIVVKNIGELDAANKKAQPGDTIILQNGEWNNVTIQLNCNGTKAQPVLFRAATAGKVKITGHSQLKLGGNYIIVDGLYFSDGYAGADAVINFRIDSKQLANDCRVTNTAIFDFNNPRRMDENYWVAFYGKNNRLDHCSFKDKKNLGVLLAVILDDDRSRANFHSIDHNYFGRRPPLASNGGEIIRVGVSQHCEFNSNTQITDNFFEHCDGETEIVSIKSCSNLIKGNLFKECQGGVVLRHGNYNTVENNVFLGNGKEGTGGVRVINKGQWVINNFFFRCRGIDFRSPLSVMNGIPNSPANRYVQVTDAVIANNTFYECSPVSFCEGSDTERSLPPENVLLINNIFYNTTDSAIYKVFDDLKGFSFWGNEISTAVKQKVTTGFGKTDFAVEKTSSVVLPRTRTKGAVQLPDSLRKAASARLQYFLSTKPGFADIQGVKTLQANAYTASGAGWFRQLNNTVPVKPVLVNCRTVDEIYKQLERKEPVSIRLTGNDYRLSKPFLIKKGVQFTGNRTKPVIIRTENIPAVFMIAGNGHLSLSNLNISGEYCKAAHLIASDTAGSSHHYNLSVQNCFVHDLNRKTGCSAIFYAAKNMVADSIVFRNNLFADNNTDGILMTEEKDDKGYYNAEKIVMTKNNFNTQTGMIAAVYRGGNDESTMGPQFLFNQNQLAECKNLNQLPLLSFTGVQVTNILANRFSGCNSGSTLILYKDTVRARHRFENNMLVNAGKLEKDPFVTEINNRSN